MIKSYQEQANAIGWNDLKEKKKEKKKKKKKKKKVEEAKMANGHKS